MRAADLAPGRGSFGRLLELRLALAVVSEPRGFQDRGRWNVAQRGLEFGQAVDRPPGRCAGADLGEEALLLGPVLRDLERPPGRTDDGMLGQERDGRDEAHQLARNDV